MMELSGVCREYSAGGCTVTALDGVDLSVGDGEMLSITGPSGSGKSTLMNILGCLDRPTRGEYILDGVRVSELDRDRLSELRSRKIGFIFQSFHLVPRLTAIENVEMPLIFQGIARTERRKRAMDALERVGLADRASHRPPQLSGGQQQRTAIARAIAQGTDILLADEPTGNLDAAAGAEVVKLLTGLWSAGKTVVMITHDPTVAAAAPRSVEIKKGRIYCT